MQTITDRTLLENVITELTKGLDEVVYKYWITSAPPNATASIKYQKLYLRKRCDMWFEQENDQQITPFSGRGSLYWIYNKVENYFRDLEQIDEVFAESTFKDMLNPQNEKVKINEKVKNFIITNAPKVSNDVVQKAFYFSNVVKYLKNSTLSMDSFDLNEAEKPTEENINFLFKCSYKSITEAMEFVSRYENYRDSNFETALEDERESFDATTREWLYEKSLEEVYFISKYVTTWKLLEETDFKVFLALFKSQNREKINKLIKSKKYSGSTLQQNLPLYNRLFLVDWYELKEYAQKINTLEDSSYNTTQTELIEELVDYFATYFQNGPNIIGDYLTNTIDIILNEENPKKGLKEGVIEIENAWNTFLEVILFLTSSTGVINKEVLEILDISSL